MARPKGLSDEEWSALRHERYLANRDKIKADSAAWRAANPERHKAAVEAWRKANPERAREHAKAAYRRAPSKSRARRIAMYGLTAEQYDAMLAAQGGVCAICAQKCRRFKHLAVDHDHATGKVRGLLCSKCNIGIGSLRDDAAIVQAAADYLKKHIE